ncbi:MAG: hypothetical protein Q9168_001853 [Polycauliona sp. 1 TL-2023]
MDTLARYRMAHTKKVVLLVMSDDGFLAEKDESLNRILAYGSFNVISREYFHDLSDSYCESLLTADQSQAFVGLGTGVASRLESEETSGQVLFRHLRREQDTKASTSDSGTEAVDYKKLFSQATTMDPFSITVGVTGLLALTAKTVQVTRSYCHQAKHAKEAASELLAELDVLHWNLSRLDHLLKNDITASFSNTSVLATSTHGCRLKLSVLHDKLEKAAAHPLHRLLWPFSSDEHRKTLSDLKTFVQWIQFALTIDGSSLLAKTSTEVMDVLTNQLHMFQLLDQADTREELTHSTVIDIQHTVRTSEASKEREAILNWISDAKPGQKHHDVRLPRVEATGGWLLEEDAFKQWRDGNENVLWCYGIQGSGKSILASLVIDHLTETLPSDGTAVVHVYLDYREQGHQTFEKVIASLLKQVASALPDIPSAVSALYEKFCERQQSPQLGDLVQALSKSCQNHNMVYIVVDALDEGDSKCREEFRKHIDDLKGSAKIFVTSRPYPDDIREAFKHTPQIEIKAHSTDLERYINRQIRDSDMFDDIDDTFQKDIVRKIVRGAQEMQTVCNEPTVGDMEDALECLPQTLHAAFEDTMQRIHRQSKTRKDIAIQTLRLICRAKRPMALSELCDALAFRPGLKAVNRKYRPSRERVLDACHGLVTIDEESQIIRLVHYSVHAFLLGSEGDLIRDERSIAKLCIDYQMLQPFASGCCQDEDEILDRVKECPFVAYAACYWGSHLLAADDLTIDNDALNFLRARPQLACSYQNWQYEKGRRKEYWNAEEAASCKPLHMAAMFGLYGIAQNLLPLYAIDETTHMGSTALTKAASCGHSRLVSLLMDNGANPAKHNWYGTMLHCAAEAGEVQCIDMLLDRGIDVDIEDDYGRAPLICAAQSGHTGAMRALLKRGADVNVLYDLVVQQHGVYEVIETLLEFGYDFRMAPILPDLD